jgi:hypothetical protein
MANIVMLTSAPFGYAHVQSGEPFGADNDSVVLRPPIYPVYIRAMVREFVLQLLDVQLLCVCVI